MTLVEWDEILTKQGPEALLHEIHVLRAALHAVARHCVLNQARRGLPDFVRVEEQGIVDYFVAEERMKRSKVSGEKGWEE